MTTPTTGPGSDRPPADDRVTSPRRIVTTTVNTPSQHSGRHAAPEAAAERGSLTIADGVLEKVATVAASEIDGVGGAARRVLGVPTSRDDGDGRPRVSARVTAQTAALDVRLTVAYPASVRAVTEAVRAHLRDRVETLTELTVSRVDISVAALTDTSATSGASRRRVVA